MNSTRSRVRSFVNRSLSDSFSVFRHSGYALLWSAKLLSAVGTWMQSIAIGVLVIRYGGGAFWVAASATGWFLSQGIVAPYGGHLADRYKPVHILRVAVSGQALVAAVLAVLVATGRVSPPWLTLVASIEGVFLALAMPAMSSLIPDLVGKDRVVAATSLFASTEGAGMVIGPIVAASLLVIDAATAIFVINALSFMFVVAATFVVRCPERPSRRQHESLRLLHFVWNVRRLVEPGCLAALYAKCTMVLFIGPFVALAPAMAQITLGGSAADTSLLFVAGGLGTVLSGAAMPLVNRRFDSGKVLQVLLLALPLSIIAYATAATMIALVLAFAVALGLYIAMLTCLQSIIQIRADDRFRGRVNALGVSVYCLTYPIGATLQGRIGEIVGLRATLTVAAGLFVVATFGFRRRFPEAFRLMRPTLR